MTLDQGADRTSLAVRALLPISQDRCCLKPHTWRGPPECQRPRSKFRATSLLSTRDNDPAMRYYLVVQTPRYFLALSGRSPGHARPLPCLRASAQLWHFLTQSGHFENLTRTRCFVCAIMCTGGLWPAADPLTRPNRHPFGSVACDSGW